MQAMTTCPHALGQAAAPRAHAVRALPGLSPAGCPASGSHRAHTLHAAWPAQRVGRRGQDMRARVATLVSATHAAPARSHAAHH